MMSLTENGMARAQAGGQNEDDGTAEPGARMEAGDVCEC
jgi:hypothetical protein